MAVSSAVRRLAARAPAPTFIAHGAVAADVEALHLDSRIRIVDSPRHATVLLVAGRLPEALHRPAGLVHDALAHPRATVWWGDGEPDLPWLRHCPRVAGAGDVGAQVCAVHADLMLARRQTEPPVLATTTRVAWKGVGPYGHGGTGMTGGTPHGRPLADRGEDLRDGLALDVLPLTVGPFFPAFPAGLTVRVSLHGDVVAAAQLLPDPYLEAGGTWPGLTNVFDQAATAAVRVAELEQARAAHHLRAVSRSLRTQGLPALATRVLRAAGSPPGSIGAIARLLTAVQRTGALRAGSRVGVLDPAAVQGPELGLLARAGGAARDARASDPAYEELGFEVITHEAGDVAARLAQRLAEIRQSLALAERAGDLLREPGPALEDPRVAAAAVTHLLPDLLIGAEWGDAVTTLASLDVVVGRAAPAPAGAQAA